MLTWVKTKDGYRSANGTGTEYHLTRTPGHRFRLFVNDHPAELPSGKLADLRDEADRMEATTDPDPAEETLPPPEDPYSPDKVLEPEARPGTPTDPLPFPPGRESDAPLPPLPADEPGEEPALPADEGDPPGEPVGASPEYLFTPPRFPRDRDGRVVHSWLPQSMHAA